MVIGIAIFFLYLGVFKLKAQDYNPDFIYKDITDDCYVCMCEAMQNDVLKCRRHLNDCYGDNIWRGCGPYKINFYYWKYYGSPTVLYKMYENNTRGEIRAWHDCVTDHECAKHLIKDYVYALSQDCNGDRVVDCDDYIRIHMLNRRCMAVPRNQIEIVRYNTCKNLFTNGPVLWSD